MAKKKKNIENTIITNPNSTVFETLFGNLPEKNDISIFSDENPFKRKSNENIESGMVLELQKSPVLVEKKRKRDKNKSNLSSDEETEQKLLGNKKLRNGSLKSSDFDVKSGENGENLELDVKKVKNGENSMKKSENLAYDVKKSEKKRKRDEVEVEYEGNKYGEGEKKLNLKKVGEKRKKEEESDEVVGKEGFDDEEKLLRTVFVGNLAVKIKKKALLSEFKQFGDVESLRIRSVPLLDTHAKGGLRGKVMKLRGQMCYWKRGLMISRNSGGLFLLGILRVKIKKTALLLEFKQFGGVESLKILSVPLLDTKKPRKGAIMQKKINDAVDSVHAYVVFKLEEAAQAALAHNMAVVGGKHIRVDRACPPRKKLKGDNSPLYDNKRTVFVGNLPFDVKDEELYQLFSSIKDLESDSIEGIRVIRDPGSSLGKGIAYVLFKTRVAANLISRKHGLKLRDRELRLSHSKSNLTPTKRKDSPSGERSDLRTKKFALQPTNQGSDGKYNFNAGGSYQGLRASKSGVEKKVSRPKGNEPVKFTPKAQSGQKVKDRSGKRPAVAARKAKALKGDSSSKQGGFKRKTDSRTPTSSGGRPNKKAKRN